ncbi:MAG: tRNA-dihydrouridine synthase [bacterium]
MFWNDVFVKKGVVLGLSPMDGVTDVAFRFMVAKYGHPDVEFSEFVSVDALHYAEGERRERVLQILQRVKRKGVYEVAQVFGRTPEFFSEAAKLVEEIGFDGIDINMGCPAHNVSEQGAGAGLIRTPKVAQEIIRTVMGATKIPVSVKTRIGVADKAEMDEWIAALMEVKPAVISLHGRTLKQLYQGEADWEMIGRAAEIVHKAGGKILGNGDIDSREMAQKVSDEYGVDGVLIGRAAEGNPAVFAGVSQPTKEQRLAWMVEHARKYEELLGTDWFMPMRKHLAWYAHGFPGAVELRTKLMATNSADEVEKVILSYS